MPELPNWLKERETIPPPEDIRAPSGLAKLRADIEALAAKRAQAGPSIAQDALKYGPELYKLGMGPAGPLITAAENRYGVKNPLADVDVRPPMQAQSAAPAMTEYEQGIRRGADDAANMAARIKSERTAEEMAQGSGQREQPAGGGGGGGGPVGPQERLRIAPSAFDAYGRAFAHGDFAARGEAQVAQQAAQAMERHYGDVIAADIARENAAKANETERQAMLDAKAAEFDSAVKELGDFKIEPTRFWTGKNTAEKIVGTISIFLSGIAGAMDKSGRNRFVEELNKQRDIDIDAQKAAFEAKRTGVQAKQTAFGMAMQRVGDSRQAEALAKAAATERMGHEAQRISAHFKGDEAKARLETLLAQLDMEKAKFLSQAIDYGMAGGGGGGGDLAGTMDVERGSIVIGPDGRNYAFRSVDEAQKYRAKEAVVRQLIENSMELERLDRSATPVDKMNPLSAYHARRDQLIGGSLQVVNTAQGGGVLGQHEVAPATSYLGAQKGFRNMFASNPGLHGRFRDNQMMVLNSALSSGNAIEGIEDMRQDRKGRVVTRFYPTGFGTKTLPGQGQQQTPRKVEYPHK